MSHRLFLAAGGGGDAIAAAMLAAADGDSTSSSIATLSWDRLIFDLVPGPRSVDQFEGLDRRGEHVYRITRDTRSIPPTNSTLPRLAREVEPTLYLLDPMDGAQGVRKQLEELAELVDPAEIEIVDVGGDIVAHGDEPELRSPLADSLILAASPVERTSVLIAGPGLDGELAPELVRERCRELGVDGPVEHLEGGALRRFQTIFHWHPSEASGLLWAAASGIHGTVEVRDHAARLELSRDSTEIWRLAARSVMDLNHIAQRMRGTQSLHAVEQAVIGIRGSSELEYESRKSREREADQEPTSSAIGKRLRDIEDEARARNLDFLTIRSLLEHLEASDGKTRDSLASGWPSAYQPPLWLVRRTDAG